MAEKKAKTAQKAGAQQAKTCPDCGAESRIVYFTGFGPRGYFWVCEKECGFRARTK